jgi:His/Glu/Gln/Arg/opine family amino acid ABC transporter permease subunit
VISILVTYYPAFAAGLALTILITGLSIIFGTAGGLVLGVLSFIETPFRPIVRVYIEVFLGIPVLVLLVWIYYVLPEIDVHLTIGAFWTAVLGLSLSATAFIAEIVCGGLRSVPTGQYDAALMLGIPRLRAVQNVVLPQALRTVWPSLIVFYITLYKLAPLASTIGVMEILHTGGLIIYRTYNPIAVYSLIAVFFLATIYPLNVLARTLQRRNVRAELLQQV